jgi:hypothetical protein
VVNYKPNWIELVQLAWDINLGLGSVKLEKKIDKKNSSNLRTKIRGLPQFLCGIYRKT